MNDPEHDQQQADLISGMFALLTAQLEDAAAIAADCQARRSASELVEGAHALHSAGENVATISSAIVALLERSPPPRDIRV